MLCFLLYYICLVNPSAFCPSLLTFLFQALAERAVTDLEKLLSELIARARMLRPQLGSRLVSTLLTYGVRCRTLSCLVRSDAGV